MDSRIEEMASVIQDRCIDVCARIQQSEIHSEKARDQYATYRRIESLSLEILEQLHMYRNRHIEDY